MKSVFETSLDIEAHMIKNLLLLNDIESQVLGEHLQGGVGDLQAQGIVRVMVASEDYPAAQKIVNEWEAEQPATPQYDAPKKVVGFGSVFAGFLIGIALMLLLLKTPVSIDGIDYDGDDQLDERWEYRGNLIHKVELDQNHDGKFDALVQYDLTGVVKSSLADSDFDGRWETRCVYRFGLLMRCLADVDGDGFNEYREDYQFGYLKTVSMYNSNTKALKKTQYYSLGKLTHAEVDLDDDGTLETEHFYDPYEELLKN